MADERSISGFAGDRLDAKLAGLELCPGIQTVSTKDGGFMSGEVTISERKGKSFPIYSLEVELPWRGTLDGKEVSGAIHMPDISMEMLDDLEVRRGRSSRPALSALAQLPCCASACCAIRPPRAPSSPSRVVSPGDAAGDRRRRRRVLRRDGGARGRSRGGAGRRP